MRAAVTARSFLLLGLAVLLPSGCDNRSDCEVAKEMLDECNAEIQARGEDSTGYRYLPLGVRTDDCSGANACTAACITATSCTTLEWVMLGGQNDPNLPVPKDAGAFNRCMKPCFELAKPAPM